MIGMSIGMSIVITMNVGMSIGIVSLIIGIGISGSSSSSSISSGRSIGSIGSIGSSRSGRYSATMQLNGARMRDVHELQCLSESESEKVRQMSSKQYGKIKMVEKHCFSYIFPRRNCNKCIDDTLDPIFASVMVKTSIGSKFLVIDRCLILKLVSLLLLSRIGTCASTQRWRRSCAS